MNVVRLGSADLFLMRGLNAMFAAAFDDRKAYADNPPSDAYLEALLAKPHVIALAVIEEGAVVGGLVAYRLDKFEQQRREIYIYDLAVAERFRRRGLASSLIGTLQKIAKDARAFVIFVQADYVDPPAIALYEKFGRREEVLHFDIPV